MKRERGRRTWLRWLMLPVLLTVLGVGEVVAQTSTGAVRGFVRSDTGEPVAGAEVRARDVATNAARSTLTTAAGFYYLAGLQPGEYELTADMIGFGRVAEMVRVQVGQTLDANLNLAVEALQLAGLRVVASPGQETRTSEVASNVTREQIDNLPMRDRNFLDLARLTPGVTTTRTAIRKTFVGGAERAEQVNVFVDGASYKNDILEGGVAGQDASRGNPFPQGAVQEFRVISQNYKAEYQKAASAIITAATRSGSNEFEGSAFGFYVPSGWTERDAITALDPNSTRPEFSRLQAGFTVGGPIQQDRLFFFGTYEINQRREPSIVRAENAALVPGAVAALGTFDTEFDQHLVFGKMTYLPRDRHKVDVSVNVRTETDIRGFGTVQGEPWRSYEAAEQVDNDVYNALASWQFAGNEWLNESQLSFQRYRWNPKPLNPDTPGRNFWGVMWLGGRDSRQEFTQDRLSLRNDVTYSGFQMAGQHVVKGGAYVDLLGYEAIKELHSNPEFNYDPNASTTIPVQGFIGYGDPRIDARNTQFGVYIQDDWTITPNLVLNLGIRWDAETNMINNDYTTPAPLADSLRTHLNDRLYSGLVNDLGGIDAYITDGSQREIFMGALQPRLGASYDIFADGRSILFGGFGVYYDRTIWNYMLDEKYRRQWHRYRIPFNAEGPTEACPNCVQWDDSYLSRAGMLGLVSGGEVGADEVFLIRNDTRPPKTHQWSAGVRQAVGDGHAVSMTYTGTRGYNGFAFVRVTDWGGLGPTYAQAFMSTDEIRTWYDAVMLKAERHLSADTRWGGSLAYTLARGEVQGEHFFSLDDRYSRPSEYPRWASERDQRHTVVANAIARLPFDVMLSGVLELGSGYPQRALYWDPDEMGGDWMRRQTIAFRPPQHNFLGLGNWFAYRMVDLRLEKDVTLRSGHRVGVLADVFNAFNFPNYGCYEADQVPWVGPDVYGTPRCADEGRRVQMGMRYHFGARSF
jgi:hypothetical protein